MRRLSFFILAITFCSVELFAQSNFKDIRITYLWDVTLSMKGFGGAPNIYDQVRDAIIADIEQISDERTEIVVIPFQNTEYCEVWRDYATSKGKTNMVGKIKSYNNDQKTNTNISAPLNYALDHIFSADKIDVMKLMTDGKDNVNPDKLYSTLYNWCRQAEEKDLYGYYVLLTDAAVDEKLEIILKEVCRFDAISGTKINEIVSLMPDNCISLNVKDDYNKPKTMQFAVKGTTQKVPSGFKVHIEAEENPYFELNEDVVLSETNTISFTPKFKLSQDSVRALLPTTSNARFMLSVEPAEGMEEAPYSMTRILKSDSYLEFINRIEKTLNFYVESDK